MHLAKRIKKLESKRFTIVDEYGNSGSFEVTVSEDNDSIVIIDAV